MERSAWTDERLDDLAATFDTNVRMLREEIHALREDTRQEFRDLRQDFRELRADFSAWQRQIAQIGWALVGTLMAAIVALVIAAL